MDKTCMGTWSNLTEARVLQGRGEEKSFQIPASIMRCTRLGFILLVTAFHFISSSSGQVAPAQWRAKVLLEGKKEVEEGEGDVHGEAYMTGFGSTLGSRPPSCARKCGGCLPCTAIQVPATASWLRTQYANYEPEGWKCKCGSSFYNP